MRSSATRLNDCFFQMTGMMRVADFCGAVFEVPTAKGCLNQRADGGEN